MAVMGIRTELARGGGEALATRGAAGQPGVVVQTAPARPGSASASVAAPSAALAPPSNSRDASPTRPHHAAAAPGSPGQLGGEAAEPEAPRDGAGGQTAAPPAAGQPAVVVRLDECPSFAFQRGVKPAWPLHSPSMTTQHQQIALPDVPEDDDGLGSGAAVSPGQPQWEFSRSPLWNLVEEAVVQQPAASATPFASSPFASGHLQHSLVAAGAHATAMPVPQGLGAGMTGCSSLLPSRSTCGIALQHGSSPSVARDAAFGGARAASARRPSPQGQQFYQDSYALAMTASVAAAQPAWQGGMQHAPLLPQADSVSSDTATLTNKVVALVADTIAGPDAAAVTRRLIRRRVRAAVAGASVMWFALGIVSATHIDFQVSER